MGHFPAGASVQSFVHFAQIINSKNMQLYDWGSTSLNTEKYGRSTPPPVDLSKITEIPTAMFVGTADDLGDLTDSRWARDQINSGGSALVFYEEVPAGHPSFMVGKNMTYVDTMIDLVNQYSSKSDESTPPTS
mmetsp:Transcript_15439/g.26120  ORF Transcript_15439/g.26120 Transcript_15439/m.26120 type:complete len:133 (+) Transcript_15439:1057-1455(+)